MAKRKRRPAWKRERKQRQDRQRLAQARADRAARLFLWRKWIAIVLLLSIALVLRMANLTGQSLWADEGNSVRLTERPLNLVIAAARADVHPPGYYVLLWGWVKLFGQSEAAVRGLSVVIGVLIVGAVYVFGSYLFGARTGWLAGFCAAVSPPQVQYSQEVRMYILVALLAITTTYAFVRWINGGGSNGGHSRRWAIVYVLSGAAGLWTHYSFPIVLLCLNVVWGIWWIAQRHERDVYSVLWWVGLQGAMALLYVPWLSIAWGRILNYGGISERYSLAFVVAQGFKFLSVGETVTEDDLSRWLTIGTLGLALLGAWRGFSLQTRDVSGRRLWPAVLGLLLLVVAPMVMMAGLMVSGRPAYRPKFFLVASPAFCLLVGSGIGALEPASRSRSTLAGRLWLLAALALIGVGAARSLRNYYFEPRYARSDYRGIAAYVESVERPGDAILLNAPNQWEVFTYYHHQRVPVYPVCRSRPLDKAEVLAELESIAERHDRLFVLYWAVDESDPDRVVERWLGAHTYKASDTWYGDVRLAVYAVPEQVGEVEIKEPLESVFLGEDIALRGYSVDPNPIQQGDILRVTLFWGVSNVPQERYKVFLHLVDEEGQLVSQHDSEPGAGMDLTTSWDPARGLIADRYGLWIPQTARDGDYVLWCGMYHVSGTSRLPLIVDGEPAGDALPLETIVVR